MEDDEIKNFFQVWTSAITSLSYCYYIAAKIPRGISRLISLLPIFYLFTILPLKLHTIHLCGLTAFFLLWLGNFKLLLFAFDRGPLFPTPSRLSHFISIACLPIKIKPNSIEKPSKTTNNTNPSQQKAKEPEKSCANPRSSQSFPISRSILLAIKVLLMCMLLYAHNFHKQFLHDNIILVIDCCLVYLLLEIILVMFAVLVGAILGFELEPQFNEPYLATSLQDFWGRRWNLMVPNILHPTVYTPVRRICTHAIGRTWAPVPSVIATFVVSGLMHEVIYYYLTRVPPTWEVTAFFVLHGVCLATEMLVKKALSDRWRLHRAISGPLVVMFVIMTSFWLFWPQLLRNGVDERIIREIFTYVDLVKHRILIVMKFWREE